MQAAEMQIKTENSVEAASTILRTLRHAVPVLLALLIALLAAAPVLADETDEAITDTETVSAEPTEDLRDDYTAVAAQLEAVARAEGRDMADKMLSTALHSLTGTSVDTDDKEKHTFPLFSAPLGSRAALFFSQTRINPVLTFLKIPFLKMHTNPSSNFIHILRKSG